MRRLCSYPLIKKLADTKKCFAASSKSPMGLEEQPSHFLTRNPWKSCTEGDCSHMEVVQPNHGTSYQCT